MEPSGGGRGGGPVELFTATGGTYRLGGGSDEDGEEGEEEGGDGRRARRLVGAKTGASLLLAAAGGGGEGGKDGDGVLDAAVASAAEAESKVGTEISSTDSGSDATPMDVEQSERGEEDSDDVVGQKSNGADNDDDDRRAATATATAPVTVPAGGAAATTVEGHAAMEQEEDGTKDTPPESGGRDSAEPAAEPAADGTSIADANSDSAPPLPALRTSPPPVTEDEVGQGLSGDDVGRMHSTVEERVQVIRSAARRVLSGGGKEGRVALETIITILTNALLRPGDQQVRSIRLANKAFQKRVGNRAGAVDLLRKVGWEQEGGAAGAGVGGVLRWKRNDPGLLWVARDAGEMQLQAAVAAGPEG